MARTRKERRQDVAVRVVVFGVVQGVGFRPFVYRIACRHDVRGVVKNAGFGVEIRAEASRRSDLDAFLKALRRDVPPLARIERLTVVPAPPRGYKGFRIAGTREGRSFVFISPDIATCPECLAEVRDPAARRFRYPFTNCTNCGPRYTIVRSLPYDRRTTTMARFAMCPACRREYEDPLDRRYHAQPIACPDCGPRVTLKDARSGRTLPGGIKEAAALVKKGRILGLKGLGGFHLVCDPLDARAVSRLRRVKARQRKPLALMARDLAAAARVAVITPAEKKLLLSARRPIVLLKKRTEIPLIAPHLDEVGVMLPYTPLHALLLDHLPLVVATSSNRKDAPIMKDEEEGLGELCDVILTHDRPIQMRADDSVVKAAGAKPLFVRRARGFVPYPQSVPSALRTRRCLLALGGELKDTLSLYKNGYVITSQFLGDLDDHRNHLYFEEALRHLLTLFDARPDAVVTDLHPDFHTTRAAERLKIAHFRVQHHFAHVLAPLLEHGWPPGRQVLGVAWDGYGYGDDGGAWGGEFLIADYSGYERYAHFSPVPLPGGDAAARQPWRMALAYLRDAFAERLPDLEPLRAVGGRRVRGVLEMMARGLNSPPTSSCGRLFDAVSYLAGVAPAEMEFEAEAAMRFEAAVAGRPGSGYPFELKDGARPFQVSFAPLIRAVVDDIGRGAGPDVVSARFHETLARVILGVAARARRERRIGTVVLTGGVFLNRRLLVRATGLLERHGFRVLRPVEFSPSDESLSVGQIAFALGRLRAGRRSASD
jgi:hydrogenase maturation protein HypF